MWSKSSSSVCPLTSMSKYPDFGSYPVRISFSFISSATTYSATRPSGPFCTTWTRLVSSSTITLVTILGGMMPMRLWIAPSADSSPAACASAADTGLVLLD